MNNTRFSLLVLILLSCCLLATPGCLAQTPSVATGVKITWKQSAADLPYVEKWLIYQGDSQEALTLIQEVQNTGQSSYNATVPIVLPAMDPGTKVRKYYSLSAKSKSGNETVKVAGKTLQGLPYLEFVAPWPDVSAPQEVLFEIIFDQPIPATVKGAKKN